MSQPRLKNSICKPLGKGSSRIAILSSIALAVIILFYPLSVGSYFQPDVYRFEDRATYHQYFEERYIFNQLTDNLIICLSLLGWCAISFNDNRIKGLVILFLGLSLIIGLSLPNSITLQVLSIISLPMILSIYVINKKIGNRLLQMDSGLMTVNYFLISFLILTITSLFISVYDSNVNNPFIDIMILLSRFAPAIMFLLIFSAFLRLILNQDIVFSIPKLKTSISFFMRPFGIQEYNNISRSKNIILLTIFMALSILIVLTPHLDGQSHNVGEDTTVYSGMIQDMKGSQDIGHFLRLIFAGIQGGDRPLSLLILYPILILFNDNMILAFEVFLTAMLAPLLVLSIYLLSKEISRSSLVALFSSFVTAVSFQVMIGVYAGFYANWIALVLGYVSLWLAIRSLKTGSKKDMIGFSISMVALLFSHSYTWTIITTFLIILLMVLRWKKIYESRLIRNILVIVACIIAIDFAKSFLIETFSAVQRNILIAESLGLGFQQFGDRWNVLVRTVEVFLGGIFGNIIILLLVFYFTIFFKFKNLVGYFSMVFLSLGILPLFFGDKIVQSRILYDIPFQIPAGLALANIFVSGNGKLKSIVIGTCLIAIAIYTMYNLGVSPR
ncbi:MAG: hypothetical protein WA941_18890 [Nitrososphaeraceae archaeon]